MLPGGFPEYNSGHLDHFMINYGSAHAITPGCQECIGYSTTQKYGVADFQKFIDYGNLFRSLGSSDNSNHGTGGFFQNFGDNINFFFQQKAGVGGEEFR